MDRECGQTPSPPDSRTAIRPTRIVAYAWGEKYVEILLNFALPALLAPRNLPTVVKTISCEVVVLTEERFFAKFNAHPDVRRIQKLCPLRLVSLDDLVCAPDKYGISLTYVLHRGCADLGPTMTDWWLLFLNADFILADGSLPAVVAHLRRGERLVAAPSYCVNAREVLPLLKRYHVPGSASLAIRPRELAKLILTYRHQTLRAKVLNRPGDHFRYMDQFYWEVDEDTLLGHQMPVAIVGMRPQRAVAEPTSYWDYGLMREFCPTAAPYVIGDSDEFLMLELRDNEVARDALVAGPMNYKELGRRMIIWVTPYQREFAQYPLTLHASDLPPETMAARAALKDAKDEILSYAPPLPSHLDHPQWNYHRYGFMTARYAYLSARLGEATITSTPAETYTELDKAWWRLDGMRKLEARRRIEFVDNLDAQLRSRCSDLAGADWPLGDPSQMIEPRFWLLVSAARDTPDCARPPPTSVLGSLDHYRAEHTFLALAVAALFRDYADRIAEFDSQSQDAIVPLEREYSRLFPKRVESANIPQPSSWTGAKPAEAPLPKSHLGRLLKRWSQIFFGELPRITRWNPYWLSLRPLVALVEQARVSGARDVLFVGHESGIIGKVADDLPGIHVAISVTELVSGNLLLSVDPRQKFDLCICDFDADQLPDTGKIYAAASKYLRPNSVFIGFYLNRQQRTLVMPTISRGDAMSNKPPVAQIYYVGRFRAARQPDVVDTKESRFARIMVRWTWCGVRKIIAVLRPILLLAGWPGGGEESLQNATKKIRDLGRSLRLELRNLAGGKPHIISGNSLEALRLGGVSITILIKEAAPIVPPRPTATVQPRGSQERIA